jgi:hypothetical protein
MGEVFFLLTRPLMGDPYVFIWYEYLVKFSPLIFADHCRYLEATPIKKAGPFLTLPFCNIYFLFFIKNLFI